MENRIYDMVIIGSGAAGLTAAIYAARARLDAVVLEKEMISGGQILNTATVDNYPGLPECGGFDLGQRFRQHADSFQIPFETAEVKQIKVDEKGIKTVICSEKRYEAKTVVLATGAHHSKLNVPGEDRFFGMGVSYCATCDGMLYKDREVAVIGGGDVALEDVLLLSRICKKVHLVHRRDALRGAKILQENVMKAENVELHMDSVVREMCGDQTLENILLENVKSKEERTLSVDGVFIAVGIVPESEAFPFLLRDARGYIRAGEDCETSVPGIYAAGDVRLKPLRQIITAAADGANAVESAVRYLNTEFA